eukprot:g14935.t1
MLSQKVAKLEQDVQNVNDRFQREISLLFGKTAINTAVEDAVKRQHQEEIEVQRQLLRKEGYEKAVAEKFNIENVSDYFVKSWIRESLDIMNKGFQVVVDTLVAQSKESKRIEGEFIYKEKEPPKVNGSGKGKATRHNRQSIVLT